jgi:hypothetical protein
VVYQACLLAVGTAVVDVVRDIFQEWDILVISVDLESVLLAIVALRCGLGSIRVDVRELGGRCKEEEHDLKSPYVFRKFNSQVLCRNPLVRIRYNEERNQPLESKSM